MVAVTLAEEPKADSAVAAPADPPSADKKNGVVKDTENFFRENWKAITGVVGIAGALGLGYYAYYMYMVKHATSATTNNAGYFRQGYYSGYGRY